MYSRGGSSGASYSIGPLDVQRVPVLSRLSEASMLPLPLCPISIKYLLPVGSLALSFGTQALTALRSPVLIRKL